MDPRNIPKIARWAAATAVALVVVVAGIFVYRARRESKQTQQAPSAVPANVEQRALGFTYSKVEGQQTLFTIHAAQATEYSKGNRSLLEDVEIVFYGAHGERHDVIRTHSCDYVPSSGAVVCQGKVSLELANAGAASGRGVAGNHSSIQIEATGVTFDRESGEAWSNARVVFQFPQGHGSAVGVTYSLHSKQIALGRNVELTLEPTSAAAAATTISAAGGMVYDRGSGTLDLRGPVNVAQPDRALDSSALEIALNDEMKPERAVAGPHATVAIRRSGGTVTFQAFQTDILFDSSGRATRIEAAGVVLTSRSSPEAASAKEAGQMRLEAGQANVALDPANGQPREMVASGDVRLESVRDGATSRLSTDALYLTAATVGATHASPLPPKPLATKQLPILLAKAWTPGRATGESEAQGKQVRFDAGRLSLEFGAGNELRALDGGAGVRVEQQQTGRAPAATQADALHVDFAAGAWTRVEETGHVRVSEAGGQASGNRLVWQRAAERMELAGDARIHNASGETLADAIVWNRASGELRATGNVRSVYFGAAALPSSGASRAPGARGEDGRPQGSPLQLPSPGRQAGAEGTQAASVVADALEANTSRGVAVFSGRARLWQGDVTVQADRIELRRQSGELVASGDVMAAFPQAAAMLPLPGGKADSGARLGRRGTQQRAPTNERVSGRNEKAAGGTPTRSGGTGPENVRRDADRAAPAARRIELWRVRAQEMEYRAAPRGAAGKAAGQATLIGGMEAWSGDAQISATRMTLELERGADGRAALAEAEGAGGVVVRQGERWGRGERASYDAKEGKFVLSGGRPTLEDAGGDRVTGDTLTFYRANDTILIASAKESRTGSRLPKPK